jgi:hypothetical protein
VITNADLVTTGAWTEWSIPLVDFTAVNPAAIKKISIGVGDTESLTPDGAGLVYIDDIRATR